MEFGATTFAERAFTRQYTEAGNGDRIVEERLELLLVENAKIAREKAQYRDDRERLEAVAMAKPVSMETAFRQFGLLLGALPPASIFIRFLSEGSLRPEQVWLLLLMALTTTMSATVGYFTGGTVAKVVREINNFGLGASLLVLPVIGLVWGIVAGAAGGVFLFVIGAVFGAFLGGTVGAAALPLFAVLHRMLKRGDMIERSHFLPLAFGITLTICSFILGL